MKKPTDDEIWDAATDLPDSYCSDSDDNQHVLSFDVQATELEDGKVGLQLVCDMCGLAGDALIEKDSIKWD